MNGTTSSSLVDVYPYLPLVPERGEGPWLYAGERRILDLYGGHAVAALGYAQPDLLESLNQQAKALFFASNAVALEVREQAARRLAGFAAPHLKRVFFANSGAEANENALRLALRFTGRKRVLAIEHAFHGRTAAAAAVTWNAADKWYGFPRTPFDVSFIPRNDSSAAERLIDGQVAAVIVEPVQGQAGAFDLSAAFMATIAAACRRHGVLLIADEVQSGMGRCGAPFASELHDNLRPDLLTTAKSLAAGFPCSALLMTEALASQLHHGDLGTTFGGGPLACALISTVIDVIERDGLIENVRTLSDELRASLPLGPVTAVQGRGFLLGLRCRAPAREILAALLERDILVGTSGDPQVIRLLPPLNLERSHIHQLQNALADIGQAL